MSLAISSPYPIFFNASGDPLNNGYLYFGLPNLDGQVSPAQIYWDAANTMPAPQPVRTKNGMPYNGVRPAQIFANSEVSIKVLDQDQSLVDFIRSTRGLSLASDLATTSGASMIGFDPNGDYSASPNSLGFYMGKRRAVFATGVAATDTANIQQAINLLPVDGWLDFFGDFVTNQRIFVKPRIVLNNAGSSITHTANTDLFALSDDIYGAAGGDVVPAEMVWTGTSPLSGNQVTDAYPGRIYFRNLRIKGPLTGTINTPAANEAVGTFTAANYHAAIRIAANGMDYEASSCWIEGFDLGISVNCAGQAITRNNRLITCKIGVLLWGDAHASELNNWCEYCFIGTALNYGGIGAFLHAPTFGGVYQYCFMGICGEGVYEASASKSLYFEGNLWRDIQMGFGGSRQWVGFVIPSLTSSSACNNNTGGTSTSYQYTGSPLITGSHQYGTNIGCWGGIGLKVQKAFFNAGSPSGTRWVMYQEGSSDNNEIGIERIQTDIAIKTDDNGRVRLNVGGKMAFGLTNEHPWWSYPFIWGDFTKQKFGFGTHDTSQVSAAHDLGWLVAFSFQYLNGTSQRGLVFKGKDSSAAFAQNGGAIVTQAPLLSIQDATGVDELIIVKSGKVEWDYQYGNVLFTSKTTPVFQTKHIQFPALQAAASYANDAAASAGGVAVGEIYRNGSQLMVRIT